MENCCIADSKNANFKSIFMQHQQENRINHLNNYRYIMAFRSFPMEGKRYVPITITQ